jgi:hypothetical protein
MYSFGIWSRKLISSMTKQFRPATIFRIPTCWTDQLGPISNLAPSRARHHDRSTCTRRSRLSACRHGIRSFRPACWGLVLVAAEKVDLLDTSTATAEQLKALSYWRGLHREDHQGRPTGGKKSWCRRRFCHAPHTRGSGMSLWRSKSSLA